MKKKKNAYEQKAQKQHLLNGVNSQAAGDLKKTAIETGKDILIGAIGGGLAGAVVGRASLLVGIAVTGVGHYMGSTGAASFGVGMMASGGYQAIAGAVNGVEKEGFEGVKERLTAFKDGIKHRLFLDKILKSKKPKEDVDGVGEVQYITYPNANKEIDGLGAASHLETLDRLEKQMAQSAMNFENKQSVSGGLEGEEDHTNGMDGGEDHMEGVFDPEERVF